MSVSVIIPILNERENVGRMYRQLLAVLPGLDCDWELIFVDDGSTDGSGAELRELAELDDRVKIIELRRNFGQTAALAAGMQHASFEILVTLDGDLQNDPADIPLLVRKLDEGFDLAQGWRKDRHDAWLSRKLPSRVANRLIAATLRTPFHDLGCTLRAIRREIALELELYGEMHRFIAVLAHGRGARCCEVVTRHHPRQFGHTKYGISRTLRVVLDLLTVKYMLEYFASPMKFFGRLGLAAWLVALLSVVGLIAGKVATAADMTGSPLLLLSALASLAGLQFFGLGLLGEVNARIYYKTQATQNFAVRELINFEPDNDARWTRQQRAA